MKTTKSGLIVPDSTPLSSPEASWVGGDPIEPPTHIQETWPEPETKAIEKLARLIDEAGRNVELLFNCIACREKNQPSLCQPMYNPHTAEVHLVCGCTNRRLTKEV